MIRISLTFDRARQRMPRPGHPAIRSFAYSVLTLYAAVSIAAIVAWCH